MQHYPSLLSFFCSLTYFVKKSIFHCLPSNPSPHFSMEDGHNLQNVLHVLLFGFQLVVASVHKTTCVIKVTPLLSVHLELSLLYQLCYGKMNNWIVAQGNWL